MEKRYGPKKLNQSLKVAQLFYEENMDQSKIAEKLGLSRPTVSRLLKVAYETGIVRIEIHDPAVGTEDLATELSKKYGIKILVVPSNYNGEISNINAIGAYAADYLTKLIRPNDVVGLGWGKTIHSLTTHLERHVVPNVQVVQIKGSASMQNENTYAYESINELANALGTSAHYLPLPTIFDTKMTKDIVQQDKFINNILELGKKANIAFFTVGTVRKNALLFQMGYLDEKKKQYLRENAVGDIVSRFIDKEGNIVDNELNDRTVGIELDDLKQKSHSILIAGGILKAAATNAALKKQFANEAILDTTLAQELLKL